LDSSKTRPDRIPGTVSTRLVSGDAGRLKPPGICRQAGASPGLRGKFGVFQDANEACAAAQESFDPKLLAPIVAQARH